MITYQGIRKKKTKPPQPDTQENIQKTREAIEIINGSQKTDATIWKEIRTQTI